MATEETTPGFFSRFKGFFSNNDKPQPDADTATMETEVADEAPVNNISATTTTEVTTVRSSMVSDESVTEKEIALRTVTVTAPRVQVSTEKDLDIRFATRLMESGGKFIFSETMKEAVEIIRSLKEDNNWQHIFTWENEIKDLFTENNFQRNMVGYTIENSDAAISLCESLIAEDGSIVLEPKQASRRGLPCFPKTHIILADVSRLMPNEAQALERFYQLHKGELPSIIKLGYCNRDRFYDKQRLILNAQGPEDVYVILCDQLIPPSLRP